MTTHYFTEHHNFQTILWSVAGATYRMVRTARQTPTMAQAASLWVYGFVMFPRKRGR